jgi:hypothetical protein
MSESQALLLSHTGKLTREQLALVPTPPGTATHRPIPHHEVVGALVDTLGLRHIAPVLAKHSKNFNLIHSLEIGVSDMQRNFAPMTEQVGRWRDSQLTDVTARLIIYQAFIEAEIDIPKHLAVPVHRLYFNPEHEEFAPRTLWSLSNAFTSALKELDPIPQFRATAKLAPFLEARLVR